MKAKCVAPFYDLKAEVDRKVGDVWDVDKARFDAINATKYGTLVEAVAEQKTTRTSKATKAKEAK